ncbi:MAG: hypothetical protein ACR2KB_12975 [Chitinophagaceae bacterium]
MKQEFITTYGKIIIERDKLFIQRVKRELSWKSISFFFLVGAIILVIITPVISRWIMLIIWAIHFIVEHFETIKKLPETSFKNRILLSEIESTSYTDDVSGFDTIVSLKLSSGKTRHIKFRKLENQYHPFIEAVSQQMLLPQSAI